MINLKHCCSYESPLGRIILASDGEAIGGLWFEGQRYFMSCAQGAMKSELPVFDEAKRWLDIYFSGRDPGETPPLYLQGTDFQLRVYQALREIPYGETSTYKRLSENLGVGCPRAVGGAVGKNPISLMIPCHRVLGNDGSLTGYAAGPDRKRWLLRLEKQEEPGEWGKDEAHGNRGKI